jgi:DNA polymerase-3 subunit epsilon
LFAIVDIETTGSKFPTHRIMELAIIRHNGREVISEWQSLFRPNVPIPPFVADLTGISEEMVAEAPLFEEKAYDITRQLDGCTFVAHDVNFDWSFLRHELNEAGFAFDARKLCTLQNSRKYLPGQPSYSLGKLCAALEITVEQRHRALGDARATASLFEILFPYLTEELADLPLAASPVTLSELMRASTNREK